MKNREPSKREFSLQNYASQRCLHDKRGWIDFNDKIPDIEGLATLLTSRARDKAAKHARLVSMLSEPTKLFCFWAFDRLTWCEAYGWQYCAGQDYRAEIRLIRERLLKWV